MSIKCPVYDLYKDCCFRADSIRCGILRDTSFPDYKCHFRKDVIDGPNMYDLEKKDREGDDYEE